MKITIESTQQIVVVKTPSGSVEGRIWEGKTESGIYVQCVVTRIAAPTTENLEQFDRELRECRPLEVLEVFPLRMVL